MLSSNLLLFHLFVQKWLQTLLTKSAMQAFDLAEHAFDHTAYWFWQAEYVSSACIQLYVFDVALITRRVEKKVWSFSNSIWIQDQFLYF